MQTIQANNYPVHFNEKGYEALNSHLKATKYSNLFVITDSNTNEYCLHKFLPYLETEKHRYLYRNLESFNRFGCRQKKYNH